jgi:hypothetical protein
VSITNFDFNWYLYIVLFNNNIAGIHEPDR